VASDADLFLHGLPRLPLSDHPLAQTRESKTETDGGKQEKLGESASIRGSTFRVDECLGEAQLSITPD